MLETLKKAFKIKEIRKRLFFTLLMLVVVRLGCQIPIPFVDGKALSDLFAGLAQSADGTRTATQDAFNFFSIFTGQSLEKMSIFALNITPYITSSR